MGAPAPNRFKRALAAGTRQIGFWLNFASPTVTEVCAGAGFDWLLIDMEHSPNELPDVVQNLRACVGGTAEPVVRVPWYAQHAEDEIVVLVQAETLKAVAEIEAIAAVEGVDGIFIGPADLAADLGHIGNTQHPDVQSAIIAAGERIKRAGKAPGFLSLREDETRKVLAAGFVFVAVGTDVALLARQVDG